MLLSSNILGLRFVLHTKHNLCAVDHFRLLHLCVCLQMFQGLGRASQTTRSVSITDNKYVNVRRSSCTVSLFLSDLGQNQYMSANFQSKYQTWMFIEIFQMAVALFHADRGTFGRTHEGTDVFIKCFAKEPKNETLSQYDPSLR